MPGQPDLRYPIGPFTPRTAYTRRDIAVAIGAIMQTPAALRAAVDGLSDQQLDTSYRPAGWTVRQVVHHLPDSHLNGYLRVKLALSEGRPTIRPYDEKRWAELGDAAGDIRLSLDLLEALHRRWVVLLRGLDEHLLARRLVHPDEGELDLATVIDLYAWHGRHHVAHITDLRRRARW